MLVFSKSFHLQGVRNFGRRKVEELFASFRVLLSKYSTSILPLLSC